MSNNIKIALIHWIKTHSRGNGHLAGYCFDIGSIVNVSILLHFQPSQLTIG